MIGVGVALAIVIEIYLLGALARELTQKSKSISGRSTQQGWKQNHGPRAVRRYHKNQK